MPGWKRMMTAVVCGAAMAGCTVGPNYKPPEMPVPAKFSQPSAATQPSGVEEAAVVAKWWENFHDPQLTSLIDRSVQQNLDLQAASARLKQARAQYGVVAADLFPQVTTNGQYTRSRAPGAGEGNLWRAGFDATWELDAFGGIRRNVEASRGDIEAAVEDRRNTLVTLTSEVALNYIQYRGFQRQIAIAAENIAAQRETLGVTRKKFEAGLKDATELDVAQAQALVETTESQLPALEQSAKQSAHALAVLLGQEPTSLLAELNPTKPIPAADIPEVPLGLPSDLLRRRPDIRRAERQLAAATARIGVATADLFPQFSLTGSLGLESNKFKNEFNYSSRFWSIGPSVSWPLLDWGRIRSNIRVQNALQEQAFINYQQTVLNSLAEVEDALVAYGQEQVRRKSLLAAVESDKRAVTLATQRYNAGLTDFLSVLDTERSLYTAQDQLVQSDRTVSTNLVALYKALGGGWESTEPQIPANQNQPSNKPAPQTTQEPQRAAEPKPLKEAHAARTGGLVME